MIMELYTSKNNLRKLKYAKSWKQTKKLKSLHVQYHFIILSIDELTMLMDFCLKLLDKTLFSTGTYEMKKENSMLPLLTVELRSHACMQAKRHNYVLC